MLERRWNAAIATPVAAMGAGHGAAQPLPTAYSLRAVASGTSTVAGVPAIQNQGRFGDCWTLASATAMDRSLLKHGILFAQAVVAVPEPTAGGGEALAIVGLAWRTRHRRACRRRVTGT